MFFPKYLEFAGGHLLVFDAAQSHAGMAARANERVLSAGQIGATRTDNAGLCGKFFGESVTLSLRGDPSLRMDKRDWFAGWFRNRPVWSTSRVVLERVGAQEVHACKLGDVQGFWCLSHARLQVTAVLDFFLP